MRGLVTLQERSGVKPASHAPDAAGRRSAQGLSEAIVALRDQGETLQEIADRFAIPRERVRKTLLRVGGTDSGDAKEARAQRRRQAAEARREEVLGAWRGGADAAAIAAGLGMPRGNVVSLIAAHTTGVDRARRGLSLSAKVPERNRPRFSDEQLIETIRLVAEAVGHTPNCREYAQVATALDLPSLSTVSNRFGGLHAALRTAGLTPTGRDRGAHGPSWTAERCLQALRALATELGELPSTAREYERLSSGRSDLPSSATLRKRVGSWPQVVLQAAGEDGALQPEISERDRAMIRLREEGQTLDQIGRRFGVSRDRVRVILREANALDGAKAAAAREWRRRAAAEAHCEEVLSAWRQGAEPRAIAASLTIPRRLVLSLIEKHATSADRATRGLAHIAQRGSRGSPDGQLIEAIRRVAESAGHTPDCQEYKQTAIALGLPSLSTVTKRFGGWNAALRAAGLSPTRRAPTPQTPRWTEERCLQALREICAQVGALPTTDEYERLSRHRRDLPSCATLRNRFGSWPQLSLRLAEDVGPRTRTNGAPARRPLGEAWPLMPSAGGR